MNDKRTVNIYGDSILKGTVYDDERKKYVPGRGGALARIGAHFGLNINNCSKFGATLKDGIRVIERDIERGYMTDIAVLEFGGNDSDFAWDKVCMDPDGAHLPKTPLGEYERLLRSAVKLLKDNGTEVIISTLPPVDGDRYFDHLVSRGCDDKALIEFLRTKQTISRYQEIYSCINASVALEMGCKLCDLREAFLIRRNYRDLMCTDGIHPNAKGQLVIADRFYRFIKSFFPEYEPKVRKNEPVGA